MTWYPALFEFVTFTPVLADWCVTWAIPFACEEKES